MPRDDGAVGNRTGRAARGWLPLAAGPALLAAVVLYLYVRPRVGAAPARVEVAAPTLAPPTPPPAPTANPPPLVPEAVPGAQAMTSPDWEGRTPAFVVHFSSYREREKAERDAADLAGAYGRPAFAVEVTLASGVWYRVVLGDFPSASAAREFRDALVAAGTKEIGGVYFIAAR